VIYSFIDEMHRLFFSTSFSSSQREAPYVIDGLMHNQVVESDIHSTDTHGFSEIIFALTHLLGILFAPRIEDFQSLIFYVFPGMNVESLKNYHIKVGSPIQTKPIEEQWDEIMRMVVSIKPLRRPGQACHGVHFVEKAQFLFTAAPPLPGTA